MERARHRCAGREAHPWSEPRPSRARRQNHPAKERPKGENVVDLRRRCGEASVRGSPAKAAKPAKKPRKAAAGQKEMLMPIAGKKPAKEATVKKPATRSQRSRPRSSI